MGDTPAIGTQTSNSGIQKREYCEDVVGNRDAANPLLIRKQDCSVTPLNGEVGGPGFTKTYSNWYPTFTFGSGYAHPVYDVFFSIPSASSDMARLMARTNPGRSNMSLPTFIGELKDLPHMLKQAGDIALAIKRLRRPSLSASADWYLGFQFGIAPLISDVRKMLDFTSLVDRKVDELERLYSKGGLRRRLQLGNWGGATNVSQFMDTSLGFLITSKESAITKARRWGTVRWRPTSMPKFASEAGLRRYARKLVFGMSGSTSDAVETAWNLIPWSWLIDWFGGVDTYIKAYNNSVPAISTKACIMTELITTYSYTRTDAKKTSCPGAEGSASYITRERYVGAPSVNVALPFLSAKQLSILGALAISRYRR
jgi:hypothetical protein